MSWGSHGLESGLVWPRATDAGEGTPIFAPV